MRHTCQVLAGRADRRAEALAPVLERYGSHREDEPERLRAAGPESTRGGPVGLLRDLQDLYTPAGPADITWTVVGQAAQGLGDRELLDVVASCEQDTTRHLTRLRTRITQAAPRALVAAG